MKMILFGFLSCNGLSILFRAQVQENIDMIRLQREVKEKSSKLEQVQAKYADLEDVSIYLIRFPKYIGIGIYWCLVIFDFLFSEITDSEKQP